MRNVISILLMFIMSNSLAQNVGIGTGTPNPQALLHLESSDKGFLPPRLFTSERNAMALSPTDEGMIVYDMDFDEYYYFDGTVWKPMAIDNSSTNELQNLSISGSDLSLSSGNTVSLPAVTFSLAGQHSLTNGTSSNVATVMASSSTSICFLTKVFIRETDQPNEMAGCRISDNGANWVLWADVENPDAYCECEARCLSWQ